MPTSHIADIRRKKTRKMVDDFADSHPQFDDLGELICLFVQDGLNLEQAYKAAVAWESFRSMSRQKLAAALKRLERRKKCLAKVKPRLI